MLFNIHTSDMILPINTEEYIDDIVQVYIKTR